MSELKWYNDGCTHNCACDITDQFKAMLENWFGADETYFRDEYSLHVFPDGDFQLYEYGDSGGGPILFLPPLQICPICGMRLKKEEVDE